MALAVLLLAPVVTVLTPSTPAALLFVETPADTTPAPAMSCSVLMSLLADSNAVEPSADPSFHCISRPALWFVADRVNWEEVAGRGAVLNSCYVARGTVTRSNNG